MYKKLKIKNLAMSILTKIQNLHKSSWQIQITSFKKSSKVINRWLHKTTEEDTTKYWVIFLLNAPTVDQKLIF